MHLMISELPELVSLGLSVMGNSLFPGAMCVSLRFEIPSQKQPFQRHLCLAKTVRSTLVNLYCLSCFLALQGPSGIRMSIFCAFNSVLLLDCQVLEGRDLPCSLLSPQMAHSETAINTH